MSYPVKWSEATRLGDEPNEMMKKYIEPLIEASDGDNISKLAVKLLKATELAGIKREEKTEIVIDEMNCNDYGNLSGDDFETGDIAVIIAPAWYQNDMLLEKGFANLK